MASFFGIQCRRAQYKNRLAQCLLRDGARRFEIPVRELHERPIAQQALA
jgi:hypothetical protein